SRSVPRSSPDRPVSGKADCPPGRNRSRWHRSGTSTGPPLTGCLNRDLTRFLSPGYGRDVNLRVAGFRATGQRVAPTRSFPCNPGNLRRRTFFGFFVAIALSHPASVAGVADEDAAGEGPEGVEAQRRGQRDGVEDHDVRVGAGASPHHDVGEQVPGAIDRADAHDAGEAG